MMSKWPGSFWAIVIALMGVVLAFVTLYHHAEPTISQGVLNIASSLVSGAIGALGGHAIGSAAKADVTTGNAPITINQGDPK